MISSGIRPTSTRSTATLRPKSPTLSGNDPFADVDFGRDFRANNYVFGIYGNLFAGEKTGAFTSSNSYAPSGSLTLKMAAPSPHARAS